MVKIVAMHHLAYFSHLNYMNDMIMEMIVAMRHMGHMSHGIKIGLYIIRNLAPV